MFCPFDYVIADLQRQKAQQFIREAEVDHLLGEINPQRQGWFSRQTRRLLRQLGHLLVALGEHRGHFEVPQANSTQ